MSSFRRAHRFFLFELETGGYKLAYGVTPGHALEILARRLPVEELRQVRADRVRKLSQRELLEWIDRLR